MSNLLNFPILIIPGDNDSAWSIFVPDLPGCFSAADDADDVMSNALEAIYQHLECLDSIPNPSSLSKTIDKTYIEDVIGDSDEQYILGVVQVDTSKLMSSAC